MSKKSKAAKRQPQEGAGDIVDLILEDHKPIWKLIKKMKSDDATVAQKRAAFKVFAPTLVAHAKPEEQTWYKRMKSKKGQKVEGLEGDIEHGLADKLCKELKHTSDNDMFEAKVKVLAELVGHHLEEEEDMLPSFKKESKKEERLALGEVYFRLRKKYL